MAEQLLNMLLVFIITNVAADWVELPKVNPTNKYSLGTVIHMSDSIEDHSSSTQLPPTTPFKTIFTTFMSDGIVRDPIDNKSILPKEATAGKNTNKTILNKQPIEDYSTKMPEASNNYTFKTADIKIDEDLSSFVKKTLQNEKNNFLHQPTESITEKLDYLTTLQNRLYAEISKYI